ncbi:MAG: VCBS repeat-containing protein [Pyrinomonadaceae bacterium]
MSLLSYLRSQSRRRLLYVCGISLFTVLVGLGSFAQIGWEPLAEVVTEAKENPNSALAEAALPPPTGPVYFDFDGDGKTDIGRWHPATTEFKVKNSNGGSFSTFTIGTSSGKPAPGRYYSSDALTDAAVFNAGTWTIRNSSGGSIENITFGQAGDIPMAADYDGDGMTDFSVIRPSTNTWWVRQSTNSAVIPYSAGGTGDIPVSGDYNADGKADIALYRPSTGVWTISNSGGTSTYTWGTGTDIPVPADYDGDGKTDVAVFRRTTGTWYVIGSQDGMFSQVWGNYGDQPTPGYYDSDNKADFSVWRPTTGYWYTVRSSNSSFDIQPLGVAGDTAVPSAYIKQIGGTVSSYDLAQSRLSPKNATGGTDLYSRNFSWGTSLVGLPGRAGLNAGFGISYNSLVWTKSGSEIFFDADMSNVSPGFRFGFPTIEPAYLDNKTGNFAYMMVTPSGGRVEFRQIIATNIYETADSSYVQLKTPANSNPNDPVENLTLTLTASDGTQMIYVWKGGAFRCSEIKDRNGNYITIVHNDYGQLTSMTDTLGRLVTVEYDGYGQPSAVKQMWGSGTNGSGALTSPHAWVSFSYANTTISTDIDGSIAVVGPPNTTVLRVLDKITYTDGSSTKFYYNGYAQVYKVENYAPDTTTKLNHVWTNLQAPNANQFDCPKFTETRTWAKDFNGGSEVVTNNSITTGQQYSLPGSLTGTATKIDVWITGHPNNLLSRTFVGESGWREGLPVATEDWTESTSGWERKRWTWTDYTQDNIALSYIVNPRVKENRVGDSANVKKTAVTYRLFPGTTVAEYGLASKVEVFDSGLSNVIKRVETDYNLSAAYTDRRIIGLPLETRAWGKNDLTQNLELVSKMTFVYDGEDFSVESNQIPAVNTATHNTANYSSTFVVGRGNLTSMTRHDVTGQTAALTSKTRYDIAGSVVAKLDPLDRKVRIDYTDNFSDSTNRNTFAYPKSITDPAGTSLGDPLHSSIVKYRYDIGANVWAQSPAPAGNTQGKTTEREYDDKGRLLMDKVVNLGGAYTRYEYPTNGIQSKVFSTIIDTNANGADALDEVMSESWSDGAGRVRRSRTPHTFDSGGNVLTWAGSIVEYDILGRAKRQSVPTEVSVPNANDPDTWAPAGDDNRGPGVWLWTYQKYDWKGRVIRKINTDGTDSPVLNDSDVLISYEGCGCAGGQQTTIEAERVPIPGTSNFARRKQKVYEDILSRSWKTEAYNWDGSIYSTSTVQFNGRDQPIAATQTEQSTSISQITSITYDGHGRLKTQHRPEQDTGTATTYNYNTDDSISSVVDARGAATNYVYGDPRGLPTQINYTSPNPTQIPVTPTVNFTYDNLGNRTQMTDGMGSVAYAYDQLSHMTAETRQFSDSLTDPTVPVGGFKMEYFYGLGGQLKSYKDPYNRQFDFGFDKTGRSTSVGGTAYAGVTSYASNNQYRAFGAVKQLTYGNQTTATMTYNNRLQPMSYRLNDATQTLFGKDYFYTTGSNNDNDGLIKKSVHFDATMTTTEQAKRNQVNTYDAQGRIKTSETGEEGLTPFGNYRNGPYQQSYSYNAFGNLTGKDDRDFGNNVVGCTGCPRTIISTETVVNNRTQGSYYSANGTGLTINDYQYDADGRMLLRNGLAVKFDTAGKTVLLDTSTDSPDDAYSYDGNGDLAKWVQTWPPPSYDTPFYYYLKSSVFGANVLELTSTGAMWKEYVFSATGSKVAYLKNNEVIWMHSEPSGKESYEIKQDRTANTKQTYDPTGAVATSNGYNGGGSCPPYTCYSQANSYVQSFMNMGYNGLEILMARRNEQLFQDTMFWLVSAGVFVDPSRPPNPNQLQEQNQIYRQGFGFDPLGGNETFYRNTGFWSSWNRRAYNSYERRIDGFVDVPGEYDPQFSQTYQYAPLPSTEELKKQILDRLDADGGKCRKFLDAVRKNLGIKLTVEGLFDKLIEKGGQVVIATDISVAGVAYYGKGGKNIGLAPVTDRSERYLNRAIHELIHREGVSGHKPFAQAGFDSLSEGDKTKYPFPNQKSTGSRDMDDTFSGYFSRLQNEFCRPPI